MLKRRGRFSCCEVGQGPGGPLIFPLPWATDESASFLVTPAMTRQILEEAGLGISEEIDLSEASIAFIREMRARAERGDPPLNAVHVIMGDDIGDRIRNVGRCAIEKRVVEHLIMAEKP